jgi:hypothetical protein
MKRILLFSLISFSTIHPQYLPTYVESSSGLNNPFLEGGRTELELADMNGDGNLDIISVGDHGSPYINTAEHGVMIWFGNGTGANWSVVQNGDFGYGGVAVGDVNNDGKLDVGYGIHHNYSIGDLGDQILEVALSNGLGTDWAAWDDGLATNGESWGMFCTDFADIDCDGDLDIGANSFGCCSGIHIYFNNRNGTWTQSFGFIGGNSTMDFVFGDVNNDGYPDFAVSQQNGTVYINDQTGSFTVARTGYSNGPDLGDVNNDGTDELSIANTNGGVEVWKWTDGTNWISVSTGLPASGGYDATQIYDMNTDGFADLTAFGNGVVTVWFGDGTGIWTQATQFTLSSPGDYKAFRIDGDADHNGYPDIVLVDEEGTWINYQNHLRFFKENSLADSLTITPVYPSPNRKINVQSVQTIKWISEVPTEESSLVKLELSINDTIGPWHLIEEELPNSGHYQWSVPENMASYEKCRFRYTVYTETDTVSAITSEGFYIIGEPVSISQETENAPLKFMLFQNYPNPFNPSTKIKFSLPSVIASVAKQSQLVTLKVYDVLGNEIATLVNEELFAGEYEVEFSAKGGSTSGGDAYNLSSGIYFYQLRVGDPEMNSGKVMIQTKKMILMK